MDSTETIEKKKLRGSRKTLLIMLVVFTLPYALAWFLFLKPEAFNLGTRNHGTLISPIIANDAYQLTHPNGTPYQLIKGSEKWMLMTFGSVNCEEACQKNLFTLQQLRRMMGVDRKRLSRAYVVLNSETKTSGKDTISEQLLKFEGTHLLKLSSDDTQSLEKKLAIPVGKLRDHILVADPKGNLVIYYPQEEDPKKIIEDIEILFGKIRGA